MMGTARQVELLRAEVGQVLREGLKELRTANATLRADHTALRTELTAAVTGKTRVLPSSVPAIGHAPMNRA